MSKTILLIHGVGCGGEVWDRMRQDFDAAGWTSVAPTLFPDLRTPTIPPAALADLRLSDYINVMGDHARELAEKDGEKPVIMGHSMGGLIAQALAEKGLASAAIFLTPAQPEGCTTTDLRTVITFWNILKVGRKKVPGGSYKVGKFGFSRGVLNLVPKAQHDAIYENALYDSGRVYMDLGEPDAIDETKITVPTLTIGAQRDRATVVKAVRMVGKKYEAAAYPGDYLEYADHAHWIVNEPGSSKVTADIIDWLGKKLG